MPYTRTVPDPTAFACPPWCVGIEHHPEQPCESSHFGPEAAFPLSLHEGDSMPDCRVYLARGVGEVARVQVARGDRSEDDPVLKLTAAEARALAAALLENAALLAD